jgi:RNA polymerase sigma-70 factor (ECF subfamily)
MSSDSVNTKQLHLWLERMRNGDAAARNELVSRVCARLEVLARKMLRRFPNVKAWAQTGDVLQGALMRLLRSLNKAQPSGMRDFYSLATVQMRRELLDLARHFSRREGGAGARQASQVPADSSAGDLLEATPAPEDVADLERWAAFHRGVEGLPPEEQEVVSLVFYHDWPQEQVAELFQVHVRTIRRWWQSALVTLRGQLSDTGP